jgi:hypothetical protein
MADIAAAREEIQKVVAFLVNRFGSEAEVFEHLTLALGHLREDSPKPIVEETVAVTEPEPLEVAATAEPEEIVDFELQNTLLGDEGVPGEPEPVAESKPKSVRQWRRGKANKS